MTTNGESAAILMIDTLLKNCDSVEVGAMRQINSSSYRQVIKHTWPGTGKLLAWAAYENTRNEANIVVRPSPYISHPWLFLDDLPYSKACKLSEKYQCIVVETSSLNFQARLLADRDLSIDERTNVQRALVSKLMVGDVSNADNGSTAGDKFGRLPNFRNKKVNKDFLTTLSALPNETLRTFDPTPFLSSPPQVGGVCFKGFNKSQIQLKSHCLDDLSANDFGYVINRLRYFKQSGLKFDAEAKKLEAELIESSRLRKSNPEDYARRTIKSALSALDSI